MKILVTVLLTALFVFALASTWVDFVQPQLDQQSKLTAAKQAAQAETVIPKKRPRKVPRPVDQELLPVPTEDEEVVERKPVRKLEKPKPSKPPEPAVESTELLADVKEQETKLAARQEALRMIYDDIRTELAAVDDLRKRTREDMANAELQLLDVAQRAPRSTSPKVTQTVTRPNGESAFIRSQALFIRKLVDEGKQETAISVLKSMKARDAAGVLASLSTIDARLADRLADTVQAAREDAVRR